MKNKKITAVPSSFLYPNFGYLFFKLPWAERVFYMLLGFLAKISENDADNVLELNILWVIKLKIKGVGDIILLLCLWLSLLYAYLVG